jgi:hypothetical protein
MPFGETIVETTEYRLVLVLPESRRILATSDVGEWHLPSISISRWKRPAEQLGESVHAVWRLNILVLDLLDGSPICAVAEVLDPDRPTYLSPVLLEQIETSELTEQQRAQIESMLEGGSCAGSPFTRVSWIEEAIAWLESETGKSLSSKRNIKQYNAGGSFALVRFHMEDDRHYWLKATGLPNVHELPITLLLSKLCGNYLPELIASKSAWNAWLMQGDARNVSEVPSGPFQALTLLEDAVESMAKLQLKTRGHNRELLDSGAFDQTLPVLQKNSSALFDYIENAMSLQISIKVPRLDKKRLQKLQVVFDEVCQRVERLGIGYTIVHGDMNYGNILNGVGHCQFVDWCEAYLGHPLVTLQHLLLLNKVENFEVRNRINVQLKKRYLDVWVGSCDPHVLDTALVYVPILAAASTFYGRGDWLNSTKLDDWNRQSFARRLAREMDRAATEPRLMEALCH